MTWTYITVSLRWRHNGSNGVSNHQPHDCLLSRLFRRRSKKTSKLRVTGLCEGNAPVTSEFPAQRASHAENVSFDDVIIWLTGLHDDIMAWILFTHYWPFCEGNSPVTDGFPHKEPIMRSFDVLLEVNIAHSTPTTKVELRSGYKLTKDTAYLRNRRQYMECVLSVFKTKLIVL